MIVINHTSIDVDQILRSAVSSYKVDGLVVEVKYCPRGSRRYCSGTYYRRTRFREEGLLIRLRINRTNRYPLDIHFKTSEYVRKKKRNGETSVIQIMRKVSVSRAEDLILAVFLHEFSHYLDHMRALNGAYKQTKADKFAMEHCERLGIFQPEA
jgi:hypothetical protein